MIDCLVEQWIKWASWKACPVLVKDMKLKEIESAINAHSEAL